MHPTSRDCGRKVGVFVIIGIGAGVAAYRVKLKTPSIRRKLASGSASNGRQPYHIWRDAGRGKRRLVPTPDRHGPLNPSLPPAVPRSQRGLEAFNMTRSWSFRNISLQDSFDQRVPVESRPASQELVPTASARASLCSRSRWGGPAHCAPFDCFIVVYRRCRAWFLFPPELPFCIVLHNFVQ